MPVEGCNANAGRSPEQDIEPLRGELGWGQLPGAPQELFPPSPGAWKGVGNGRAARKKSEESPAEGGARGLTQSVEITWKLHKVRR